MRIFCITDTHFGHENLADVYNVRPSNFGPRIINACRKAVTDGDLLVHLGDVVVGKTSIWLDIAPQIPGRKILVTGNHDKRSYQWYLKNGFSFVCRGFEWDMYGLRILFTHEPQFDGKFDMNIHGHLHAKQHRELQTDHRHCLLSMENCGYQPQKLETIVKQWRKKYSFLN